MVNESSFPALGAVSQGDTYPDSRVSRRLQELLHDQIIEVVSRIKEVQIPIGLDGEKLVHLSMTSC